MLKSMVHENTGSQLLTSQVGMPDVMQPELGLPGLPSQSE